MAIPIRRRELVLVLGGIAAAWPLAARAQQPTTPVIGFISGRSPDESEAVVAFRQGLAEAGYVEGQNVQIAFRWAEGHYERLPMMAADLARRQVTAILATGGNPPVFAVKAATATIPIVFIIGSDPVEVGFGKTFGLRRAHSQRDRLLDELYSRVATLDDSPLGP